METLWLPLGAAALDWLATGLQRERLQALTKPLATLAVLGWLLIESPWPATPAGAFSGALLCALVGDVLLLPALDRFGAGLAAFFLAHLFFVAGLNVPLPPANASTFLFAVVVALLAVRVHRRVQTAIDARGLGRLKIPILAYSMVLSLTLFSGLATLANPAWTPAAALAAAAGAVLFALSDIALVWNRFVKPFSQARLTTRIAYRIGLICLAAGALL